MRARRRRYREESRRAPGSPPCRWSPTQNLGGIRGRARQTTCPQRTKEG
ncbi:MAG: hypothetical protein ACETVR_02135 [Candidatus Bathyarchaeia archaeon]